MELREQFAIGDLIHLWHDRYADVLFDSDDVRIALSQKPVHFYEWLAAIVLHHATGFYALVEKYQFGNHSRKLKIFTDLAPESLLKFVAGSSGDQTRRQAPDLLMYRPDHSDYFFCEVKGPRDRRREDQEEYFEHIQVLSGKPVHMLRFTELE